VAVLSDEVSFLREKIHKCRHNEIVASLVCIIGVGLLLFSVISFQFIGELRLISFVMGTLLASGGFVMNGNYHMKRAIHQKILNEMKK
jgi:membrane-bound ClpP family serine protease